MPGLSSCPYLPGKSLQAGQKAARLIYCANRVATVRGGGGAARMAEQDLLPAWAFALPPGRGADVALLARGPDGGAEVAFGDKRGLFIGRNSQVVRRARLQYRNTVPSACRWQAPAGPLCLARIGVEPACARQVCEVVVDHRSTSRVHACVAHDAQQRAWLVDLGSVHGARGRHQAPCAPSSCWRDWNSGSVASSFFGALTHARSGAAEEGVEQEARVAATGRAFPVWIGQAVVRADVWPGCADRRAAPGSLPRVTAGAATMQRRSRAGSWRGLRASGAQRSAPALSEHDQLCA